MHPEKPQINRLDWDLSFLVKHARQRTRIGRGLGKSEKRIPTLNIVGMAPQTDSQKTYERLVYNKHNLLSRLFPGEIFLWNPNLRLGN